MTLVNTEFFCILCRTISQHVKKNPGLNFRIKEALKLEKVPPVLTKIECDERIGVCDDCEDNIKLLEKASTIREKFSESLKSETTLACLSEMTSKGGSQLNGHSPHHLPFAQSLQQTNEITPQQQHSIKRKISGIMNSTSESQHYRYRQLKRHITDDKPAEQIPNGMYRIEPTNSSDEENALVINELSSSVSPHSSYGSLTPPPISPSATLQQSTQQVLLDVTCGRKRRKQARPAKAAGDVVPAVPQHHNALSHSLHTPPLSVLRKSLPADPPKSSPQTPVNISRPSSTATPQGQAASPGPDAPPVKHGKFPVDSKLSQVQLATAAHNLVTSGHFTNTTLPFTYSSLYQTNNLFSNQNGRSTAPAALLAQSLYNAASTNPLINNPLLLAGNLHAANVVSSYQNSSNSKAQQKSNGLLSAKKEPKVPSFTYVNSLAQKPSQPDAGGGSDANTNEHKLVKTEKRRYCKVCAASNRKANNGRPPQSRFLCQPCNMPMCRSCIEEHRARMVFCAGDSKADVKSSASAKLLQAVKMKDKASGDSSKTTPISGVSKALSSVLSAPPSHSSIIFGAPSTNTLTSAASTVGTAHSDMSKQTIYASLIPNVTTQLSSTTPLDMRLPSYKPIAPAPPKESTENKSAHEDQATPTDDEENDEDEKRLVMAEDTEETDDPPATNTDQTAITSEIANETVAMLMPIDDESASSSAGVQNKVSSPSNQSFQAIPQVSTSDDSSSS